MAVRTWDPFEAAVVSHCVVKEGPEPVTRAPRLAPSNWNCTEASPMAEAALAVTVTVLTRENAPVGLVMLTVGGGLFTVTDTGADVVLIPTASVATAVRA